MTALEPWRRHAAQRYRAQTRALAAPMTNIPLVGDPRLTTEFGVLCLDPVERLLCLYAAEVLKRRGVLPLDASGFDARVKEPSTVVFTRADASQAELGRLTVDLTPADVVEVND